MPNMGVYLVRRCSFLFYCCTPLTRRGYPPLGRTTVSIKRMLERFSNKCERAIPRWLRSCRCVLDFQRLAELHSFHYRTFGKTHQHETWTCRATCLCPVRSLILPPKKGCSYCCLLVLMTRIHSATSYPIPFAHSSDHALHGPQLLVGIHVLE